MDDPQKKPATSVKLKAWQFTAGYIGGALVILALAAAIVQLPMVLWKLW